MEENNEKRELLDDTSGKASLSEEALIKERKDKFLKFFKNKSNWIAYIILILIVLLAIYIRTLPMQVDSNTGKPKLWDVSTDSWTLGPDLDPFLFLRWSEYIVEHGKLFTLDPMRYVPMGFDTRSELLLTPYMIAWLHEISLFWGNNSVTYSAVIYPVVMFALTVIAFFLFTRKAFADSMGKQDANIIALIASFFLTVMPVFMPRTIAGIPEKESSAFFFMFLSLYLFLCSWKAKRLRTQLIFAILAGIATAGMALVWGGYTYLLLTFSCSIFIAFVFGSVTKNRFYSYLIWIVSHSIIMWLSSTRYHLSTLLVKGTVVVAFIILVHFVIFNTKLKRYLESGKLSKWPPHIVSIIFGLVILLVVATVSFGFNFVYSYVNNIVQNILTPVNTRFILTVAENRSPFFQEWVGSFGPIVRNIPLFFWLFFLGSIFLFYKAVSILNKKDRIYSTLAYTLLLFAVTFSKYSSNSTLNGTSRASILFYASGFIIFLASFAFYYYNYYKKGEYEKLKNIDLGILFVLLLFLLTIVSLRGGIRLVMVLTPTTSIIVAYFLVISLNYAMNAKGEILKVVAWVVAGLVLISSIYAGWQFYNEISAEASVYAPSAYTQQWQRAMGWVRDNTPENAVFGHWWDYGYWVQSMGKRATVLDGGNAQGYWDFMMGRYGLTDSNETVALEFLYAHNTTHFLIDSTDIGKYSAFSSIGSDLTYDRASWIPSFVKDNTQVQETKNGTLYVYSGGTPLDEDIRYEINDTKIFLPGNKAGLGAILTEQDPARSLVSQPIGIFVYQNKQYRIPLRYAFFNGKLKDFGSGLEVGIFLMIKIDQNGQEGTIEKNGALLYLSRKTVKSQLARLYLYKEDDPYFKLVHSEDDSAVAWFKSQKPSEEDIIYFNGVRGPIRIWEIKYPDNIEFKDKYLSIVYPKELDKVT